MLKENTFMMKKYRKLFWASILGWLVSLLSGMADSVIAGLFLDSEAVSAVGLITPISSIIYFISVLVAIGCSIMYSTALGAFQKEKSERIAGMGLMVSIVIGAVLCTLVAVFKDNVLEFYGCTGTLYDYANEYYKPYIVFSAIAPTVWLIYHLVSYDGDESIILGADILMAGGNAFLSFFLVQSRGIEGLSLGTCISEASGFFLILIHFFKKSNSIKFKLYFNFKELGQMVILSSAGSLTTFYMGVVDVVFNKFIISNFGEELLPAYTVVNAVLNVAAILICAVSGGLVFISVAYGENNTYALRRTMKIINRQTILLGAVFTVILFFIAPYWPSLFAIEDPEIAAASIFAGRVVPLTYIAAALVFEYLDYYPVVNRALEGNLLSIGYMLIGPIVLAIPAGLIGGFNGMTVGFALTPVFSLLAVMMVLAFKKELKKAPLLIDDTDEKEAHFDIQLDVKSIVELRNKIEEFLKENNVDEKYILKILIIVEDTLMHIKNKNKKKVLCETTVLVNDKHVRLITKDNGIIFDIMKEAEDSLTLRSYIEARVMASASEKSNTTTISFNRNTYIWNFK